MIMSEARSRTMWNHTSSIWALFADIYRDPKTKAKFKLADFNPHVPDAKKDTKKYKMSEVKDLVSGAVIKRQRCGQ